MLPRDHHGQIHFGRGLGNFIGDDGKAFRIDAETTGGGKRFSRDFQDNSGGGRHTGQWNRNRPCGQAGSEASCSAKAYDCTSWPLSPRILETYRKLDAERLELAAARKEALRSKVRRLLLAAAAFSIITHVLLLLYRYQIDRPEVPPESISFRLALDASEEVALSPGPDFEDLLPGLDAVDLEPTDPAPAFYECGSIGPRTRGRPCHPFLGWCCGRCWGGLRPRQRIGFGGWWCNLLWFGGGGAPICVHRGQVRLHVDRLNATPGNLSVGRSSGDTRWRRAVAELLKSIAKLPTKRDSKPTSTTRSLLAAVE